MLQLSVSTQQGPYGVGRVHACSKKHRLRFNTCDELGMVSEKEPVEQPGSSHAERLAAWGRALGSRSLGG